MRFLYFLFILAACSCEQIDNYKTLSAWNKRKIEIPKLEMKVLGKDTICQPSSHKDYNILVYVDSSGCLPCNLRLYDWRIFINEINKKTEKVGFIFIINGKFSDFELFSKNDKFYHPVFYDRNGLTNKLNHFPVNKKYNTFLLDAENKVLLIGRPFETPKMMELYKNILLDQ